MLTKLLGKSLAVDPWTSFLERKEQLVKLTAEKTENILASIASLEQQIETEKQQIQEFVNESFESVQTSEIEKRYEKVSDLQKQIDKKKQVSIILEEGLQEGLKKAAKLFTEEYIQQYFAAQQDFEAKNEEYEKARATANKVKGDMQSLDIQVKNLHKNFIQICKAVPEAVSFLTVNDFERNGCIALENYNVELGAKVVEPAVFTTQVSKLKGDNL